MRDISEMDSVGRRGMTGTGSVEERKSPVTSKALRGLEGSTVPQPFFLLCFRSSFPKYPNLGLTFWSMLGVQPLEVRNCDSLLVPSVPTHRSGFSLGSQP